MTDKDILHLNKLWNKHEAIKKFVAFASKPNIFHTVWLELRKHKKVCNWYENSELNEFILDEEDLKYFVDYLKQKAKRLSKEIEDA